MDKDLIHSLKEKWDKIYLLDVKGQDFVIRPLTFDEFDLISKIYDKAWDGPDAEEAIVSLGVIYPETFDINKSKAGIITSLSEEILTVSGFIPDDEYTKKILFEKREEMREFRNMMKAFIIAAMPGYTDEDLDRFTFEKLAYKLALAEKVISIQQEAYGMEPSDLKLQFVEEEEPQINRPVNKEDILEGKPPAVDPVAQKLHQALMG